MKKFSIGWYMFALIGGLASGLMFSKAQYHKGKADAYKDINDALEKFYNDVEEYFANREKEDEAQK